MRFLYKEQASNDGPFPEFIKCKSCTCVFATQDEAIPKKCPQCRSKNKSGHMGEIEEWWTITLNVALAALYDAKA